MRTSHVTWFVSMGVHGLLFLGSSPARSAHEGVELPPTLVHFSVPEPVPGPAEQSTLPEPEPEPEPEPKAPPQPGVQPEPELAPLEPDVLEAVELPSAEVPPDPAVEPETATELEAPEPAADSASNSAASAAEAELTGTTLTGEGNWTAQAGSGRVRRGAITAGSSSVAAPIARPAPAPTLPSPGPPAAVPLKDLAQQPGPRSSVGDLLRRNYPADERAHGVAGGALVRARIEPSGRVQTVEIVGASNAHFGEACRRTLQQSRWSAPRDAQGRAVPTWIKYRCDFVVQR